MSKFIDLTGQKFNRLRVIELSGKNKQSRYKWLCKCDCGNEVIVNGTHLSSKHTQSCGCFQKERASKTSIRHNMRFTSEYNIWCKMKERCYSKNSTGYKYWGGRGIKVCEEWENSFINFYKDMGDRPKEMSIDRIDNNKGYSKENCRWATRRQQARNTRRNRMLTYMGETKCLAEWAEKLNLKPATIFMRLRRGWNIEKAFNK